MGLLGFYSFEVLKIFTPAMNFHRLWNGLCGLFMRLCSLAISLQLSEPFSHDLHFKRFHERELTTLEQTMQDAAKEAEMAKGGDE